MFEDKQPKSTQPPQNLPTGNKALGNEPEDILADIEGDQSSARTPVKNKPFLINSSPLADSPQAAVRPPEKPVAKEPFFKQYKKIIIAVLLIIIGGGVLAAAGWYGYKLVANRPDDQAAMPTDMGYVPPVDSGNNQPNADIPAVDDVDNQLVDPAPPMDSDLDGLTDEEESMYGTNINEVDTDLDGLTDRDEVKVFKTDPNNPDTDGDGYLDGAEVRSGYDPKGEGKLLEIE